jgi:hypothetical protein
MLKIWMVCHLSLFIQYTKTLDEAIAYINKGTKKCRLILGVGDGKFGTARMI